MATQCRACMNAAASQYIDMNSAVTNAAELDYFLCFSQVTKLSSAATDELPNLICNICARDLQIAYDFIQTACQAEKIYRKHLTNRMLEQQQKQQRQQQKIIETTQSTILTETDIEPMELASDHLSHAEFLELADCDDPDTDAEVLSNTYEEVEILQQAIEAMPTSKEMQANILHIKEELDTEEFMLTDDDEDSAYLLEYDNTQDDNDDDKVGNGTPWQCSKCERILRSDVSFEGHLNWHNNLRPYQCPICAISYRCESMLNKHLQLEHNQTIVEPLVYACGQCAYNCDTKQQLQEHEQQTHSIDADEESSNGEKQCIKSTVITKLSHNSKLNYECSICELTMSYDKIETHLQIAHPEQDINDFNIIDLDTERNLSYKCGICKQNFHNEEHLRQHRQCHVKERKFQCEFCLKRFATQCNLTQHLNLMHPTSKERSNTAVISVSSNCKICQKQLLTKNLEKHMEMHARKIRQTSTSYSSSSFLCIRCPHESKTLKLLQQHEKTHNINNTSSTIDCTDCNRKYKTVQQLEQHRRQAHKARDHVCDICGNAFKLKNQLVNHMKLHLEKNIPCPQCDKKYARSFDLDVHMRTHTGELPFKCNLCDRRFAIKVRLTYHMQKHLGIRHRCKECNAEFNSKQKLRAHSYKHTGMPYRCNMCEGHGFPNRDVFKRHLNRVHHTSMSNEELTEMFKRNTGRNTQILPVDKHALLTSTNDDFVEEYAQETEYIRMEAEIDS